MIGAEYIWRMAISAGIEGPPYCFRFSALDLQYSSICVALNALLTLMIIARLVLHSRSIRSAFGTSAGVTGVYTTIVTILTEACTPYTIVFLVYLAVTSNGGDIFISMSMSSMLITRLQVCAIFPVFYTLQY